MNREIKFRGRRLDNNNEWIYGYFYNMPMNNIIASFILTNDFCEEFEHGTHDYELGFHLWKDLFPVDKNTIGQFTGLYDKNGKEVYEGDILKVECTDGSSIYKIVRFVPEKAAFCMANTFEIKDEGIWDIWSYVSQRGIKEIEASVIGNIHDNPKLLKQ